MDPQHCFIKFLIADISPCFLFHAWNKPGWTCWEVHVQRRICRVLSRRPGQTCCNDLKTEFLCMMKKRHRWGAKIKSVKLWF
jgi:hypothetical protein